MWMHPLQRVVVTPAALALVFAHLCTLGATPHPVPDGPTLEKSFRTVREVYREQYAQTAPAQRRLLARTLLRAGGDTKEDLPNRYALLRESREQATDIGDVRTALKAVDALCAVFEENRIQMALTVLVRISDGSRDAGIHEAVVRAALNRSYDAVLVDDYAVGQRLVVLAEESARKARNPALARQSAAVAAEVGALAQQADALAEARRKVAVENDAAAHLLIGQHLCLIKNQWQAGLQHLARGADARMVQLAQGELAGGDEALLEIASGWWDLAESQTGLARRHLRIHAAELYRKGLPRLSGLNRGLADSRLEAVEQEALASLDLRPGLKAEMFSDTAFKLRAGTRIDPNIDFDWGEAAPDPALGRDNFAFRWSGRIHLRTPGRYTFTVLANTGVRLFIDEQTVLDRPNLTSARNVASASVSLEAGLHTIRIEHWDTSGAARMRLRWQPPGGATVPVPAPVLWHDPDETD